MTAGGRFCCDLCGTELPSDKRVAPYFNATCTDTEHCAERQASYREMRREIIAGLKGETVWTPPERHIVKHRKRPKDPNLVARTAEALKARLNAEERQMTRSALRTFGPDYSGERAI